MNSNKIDTVRQELSGVLGEKKDWTRDDAIKTVIFIVIARSYVLT